MSALNSQLFVGSVRHRRFTPKNHALTYPCLCRIDLDEWTSLSKKSLGLGEMVALGKVTP